MKKQTGSRSASSHLHKKHTIKEHELRRVARLKKHRYHHIIHRLHYKHRISLKTLFYMKEYGPRSHVAGVIINQSLKMLILASIISSVGGVHLSTVKTQLVTILPLLILLPALNSLIGSFGTIMSSKFTTMLFLGKVPVKWWQSEAVHRLIFTILVIGIIASVYIAFLAYGIAALRGFVFDLAVMGKLLLISMLATLALVGIICLISIIGGLYIFRKKEDPNNFLIPITTSLGDIGSMLLFGAMVAGLF